MDYSTLDLPILESRVDWLTATAGHDFQGKELHALGQIMVERASHTGHKLNTWSFQGYKGFASGDWRAGWGVQGAIVVVSGVSSNAFAPVLADAARHWSRVDYAVTVLDRDDSLAPDNDYWERWPWRDNPIRAQWDMSRVQQHAGGSTLAVGQRAAAYYMRVYNKYHESRGEYPRGAWRWEIEMKRHASEAQQRRWRQSTVDSGYIRDMIATEFERKSLPVPWRRERAIERDPQIKLKPDVERTLDWLRRQVRPSVDFASQAVGVEQVLEALNLPHIVYKGEH